MKYKEIKKDLFTCNDNCKGEPYVLAQCISADLAMAAGIAVTFNEMWGIKDFLQGTYGNVESEFKETDGMVIRVPIMDYTYRSNVYNLITKARCYEKPTYQSVINTLQILKEQMVRNKEKKLAIPKIACGIDRLDWSTVREHIKHVFEDTDIEILVCKR